MQVSTWALDSWWGEDVRALNRLRVQLCDLIQSVSLVARLVHLFTWRTFCTSPFLEDFLVVGVDEGWSRCLALRIVGYRFAHSGSVLHWGKV